MSLEENLSRNIRALRRGSGLSLVAFAKKLGISKSTLQNIEAGKGVRSDTLTMTADNLGIPPSVLVSDALPPDQFSILDCVLKQSDWFGGWPFADQRRAINLMREFLEIAARNLEEG